MTDGVTKALKNFCSVVVRDKGTFGELLQTPFIFFSFLSVSPLLGKEASKQAKLAHMGSFPKVLVKVKGGRD